MQGQRIFYTGHSFHVDIVPIMQDIAESTGISSQEKAGLSAIGGSRVIQHWDVPDAGNKAKEALGASKVDVLTMAPIFMPDEGIDKFATLALEKNTKIRITVQEDWLWRDTYEQIGNLRNPRTWDYDAISGAELWKIHAPVFKSIDEHIAAVNQKFGRTVLFIVPAGQAVIALRERIIAGNTGGLKTQTELFRDRVGHPEVPLQVLVAYCHYAVIYRRSPVGLPMPEIIAKARKPEWGDETVRVLQEVAWEAVTQHPQSGVSEAGAAGKDRSGYVEGTRRMNTRIKLVHCDTLSCEPILRRMPDGALLCVSQCGDLTEPAPGNRVHAFRSDDQGEKWNSLGSVHPETGEAVYVTEVMELDGVVSAFLQVHSGRFLNMRCVVMQSRDSGRTWTNAGPPPYFPTFCFVRGMLPLANGEIILACQYFPVSQEENARLVIASHNIADPGHQRAVWDAAVDHVGNDVIISADRGKTFRRFAGPKIPVKGTTGRGWAWTEPTLAALSDGRLVMLLRVDGSGCLWRSESRDLGRTWTEAVKTDIPNPGNKPKLIPMVDGRIALIHTPNPVPGFGNRYPLSLWISDDDLASFREKRVVTGFP